MTALLVPSRLPEATALWSMLALREWLSERWAILFSHPGDFDQEQLERQRWLSVLVRNFREHDVRAIALTSTVGESGAAALGWLAELGSGCAATLAIGATRGAKPHICGSALHAEIAASGSRFVIIIDPDLRCRRTLRYRSALDPPSQIELLGWTVALRKRGGEGSGGQRDVTALATGYSGCESQVWEHGRRQTGYSHAWSACFGFRPEI